jgi:hypothetical protein
MHPKPFRNYLASQSDEVPPLFQYSLNHSRKLIGSILGLSIFAHKFAAIERLYKVFQTLRKILRHARICLDISERRCSQATLCLADFATRIFESRRPRQAASRGSTRYEALKPIQSEKELYSNNSFFVGHTDYNLRISRSNEGASELIRTVKEK